MSLPRTFFLRFSTPYLAISVVVAGLLCVLALSETAAARCVSFPSESLTIEIERVTVDGAETLDLGLWRTRSSAVYSFRPGQIYLSTSGGSPPQSLNFSTIIPDGGLIAGGSDASR